MYTNLNVKSFNVLIKSHAISMLVKYKSEYSNCFLTGSPFKIDLRNDNSKALALCDNTKHYIVEGLQWYFLQALGYCVPVDQLTMLITGY